MNDTETITSWRRLLRDVQSRRLLMEQLRDRGRMDSGQVRVGVAKAARVISA